MYKNGEDYESDDEEDLEGFEFEGGEDELEQLKAQLTDEQLEELKQKGITPEEYLLGLGDSIEGDEEEGENE